MFIPTTDQTFHDSLPEFKASDRKRFFYLDERLGRHILPTIRTDANKVFVMVVYGYFKATGQFYDTARQTDIDYVAQKLKYEHRQFHWDDYKSTTRDRHREQILEAMEFVSFDNRPEGFDKLIINAARAQKNPGRMFTEACKWLPECKTEIPKYQRLKDHISDLYSQHQQAQFDRIATHLKKGDAVLLDELLEKTPEEADQWQVHRLTILKKFNQSTRTNSIRENIAAFDTLRPLYEIVKPVVAQLDYTSDGLRRFAASVNRQQVFQLKRLNDPSRYLRLMCFTSHQYRQLEDILIDTILVSEKSATHEADKKAKDEYYQHRNEQSQHTQKLVGATKSLVGLIAELQEVLENPVLGDSEKVSMAQALFQKAGLSAAGITNHVNDVQADLDQVSGQALLMKHLEQVSLKLQRKCNDIILRLEFQADPTAEPLLKAITKFKQTQGKVDNKFPVGFLSKGERTFVEVGEGLNKPLYKILMIQHIAAAIKSGILSVANSYKYRRLDEYLIPEERWSTERLALLTQAEMLEFEDVNAFLEREALELDARFNETNDHILTNENSFVDVDGLGGYKLLSERNTMVELVVNDQLDIELFPHEEFIHITEAINTVNQASGFLNEFDAISHSHLKGRPDDRNFYAGIIALGAQIGTRKLAKLSRAIKDATLESTTLSYFGLDNLHRASDAIVRFVNRLPLSSLFENEYGMQTSSDGQKYSVGKESFNANFSFKYGGRDRVLSAYTFTDARGLFPYSMVISGAEREAHYMIDGLLKNDVVKSDMHSTDTHGYTEAVFGMSYLMKFSFAPRIKNVHNQQLYAMKYRSVYKQKKYPVLPDKRIDADLIRQHWDGILRLIVSVKLGEVTASQIFKRLNSYSSDSNPLYNALKELGRIPKTTYILRYIDDLDLRKAVHKQLNKGESGNRLDRALAIGRHDYAQTLKEDQQIAECCKRILKNVVVCWNFMYVSSKLVGATNPSERNAILEKVRVSSLLAWEHFILHGEFDFSDARLQDSQKFDFESMMDPKIVEERPDDK
ncbi:MAG: Tn3 family transposase [Gammaproteobacteria bacterium]|nr:MAG: Tn3 family transposase [Gammaproteobacteria bacterium]